MATIQGIYVALFGRPADPAGLGYFNIQTQNGADLTAIGDLASTAEYQARFAGMSNEQIITSIFQSLFDRQPEQAGLEFYLNALADGSMTINSIAIEILNGAQGPDLASVNAKIAAADLFTTHLDLVTEQDAYAGNGAAQIGRDYLDSVTVNDPATATEAEMQFFGYFPMKDRPQVAATVATVTAATRSPRACTLTLPHRTPKLSSHFLKRFRDFPPKIFQLRAAQ